MTGESPRKIPLWKFFAFGLFFLLPIVGFFLGMEYQKRVYYGMTYQKIMASEKLQQAPLQPQKRTTPKPAPPKVEPYKLKKNCPKYGFSSPEEFLRAYRVRPGDTLLSIAHGQLDDSSRYNEIIVLNSSRLPHLSFEDPYLEVGWTLYLPPISIRNFEEPLAKINGEISEIDENGRWRIDHPGGMGYFLPTERTELPQGVRFKVGDCVSIIYQSGRGIVYSVALQK